MKSLMENGYPEHFIRLQCNLCYISSSNQRELTVVAVLPCLQGLSVSIKGILQEALDIKTIFRHAGSL